MMRNMVYIGGGQMGHGGQDRTRGWPNHYGDLAKEYDDVEYRSASLGMTPDPVIVAMVAKAKKEIDRDFARLEARFISPHQTIPPAISAFTAILQSCGCSMATAADAFKSFWVNFGPLPFTAPWPDFKGQPIHAGDFIQHPSGEVGQVILIYDEPDAHDAWRVDYGGGDISRLSLQIGDKGPATVIHFHRCCDDQTPAFDPTDNTIYCQSCDSDLMTNSNA